MSNQDDNNPKPEEQKLTLTDAVMFRKREDDSEQPYYSLTNATADLIDSKGAAEFATSTAKLAAKSIFNIGRYIVSEGPKAIAEVAEREKKKLE